LSASGAAARCPLAGGVDLETADGTPRTEVFEIDSGDSLVSQPAIRTACDGSPRPRFRGVSHQVAFVAAVPLGVALALSAHGAVARFAAATFAASVIAMFGVSALFHRLSWSTRAARRIGSLDHAAIFALIAGTYTPVGLLAVDPAWRVPMLTIVWGGAVAAVAARLAWRSAPLWVAPALCVLLGWVAVVVLPQVVERIGVLGSSLLVAGGLAYTVGAVVYARRRPDPVPAAFGYHELFHALVIVAVACQYGAVAFFVLPTA
jgi:hemolysin III